MTIRSAIRSLMRVPLRSLFTLLTIAVGLAGFFCMTTLTSLVPQSVNQSAKQLLGADLAVQSYLQPTTLNDLKQIVAESERQAMTGAYVSRSMIASAHKTSSIVVKGIEPGVYPFYGGERFSRFRGLQADEAFISRQAAERLQVSTGDIVSLVNNNDGSMTPFRIKGLVEGVQETFTDSGFWGTIYLTYPKSLELFGLPDGTINEAFIRLHDSSDSKAIKEQIQKRIAGSQAVDLEDKKAEAIAGTKGTLLVMQLFSLLAIGIAGITISNTITIQMSARLRDVAIMKAIGMTTRRIARYFLLEAAVMGGAGAIVGILAGAAIGMGLTASIGNMLGIPLVWQISSSAIVFTIVVGISVALISAWSPVYGAMQVSPSDLLQQSGSVRFKIKLPFRTKLRLFLVVCLEIGIYLHETLLAGSPDAAAFKWIAAFVLSMLILGVILLTVTAAAGLYGLFYRLLGRLKHLTPLSLFIPLHNLGSEYKRNALLTITLSVGVLSVVASQLFADNLISSVEYQMERQWKGNLLVSAAAVDEQTVTRTLRQTPGIEGFNKAYEMRGSFARINGEEAVLHFRAAAERRKSAYLHDMNVSVHGIDPATDDQAYRIMEGRGLRADDNGRLHAVLLENYARDLGIGTGDTVDIMLSDRRVSLKVVGFFESGTIKTAGIYIPASTLETYGRPARLVYHVEASAKATQHTLSALQKSLPSSAVAYSINGTVVESLRKTLDMQSTFFSTIALFSFLTAILMIGNQVVISLLQKKRDVAILKTIGLSTGRLLRSVLAENLILAFIAGAIGSAFGLAFALFALSLVVKGTIDLDLAWCGIGVGLSMLTTAIVTVLASLRQISAKPLHLLRGP
ncbi:ABC transporter permease [Paenibacillus flagellatus]|uniref:ABC transporter substrate-binding protein n=1 Tax=Paenibacillus flagellatus TaxID=2211139 RepID=A0A2V5KFQ8_9BACL|nr:ABC transporter permease [Paenibacillus flagellatus]PYI56993.1 ABC transporter substrate-binding protein [Paenibacillus flagellatus]